MIKWHRGIAGLLICVMSFACSEEQKKEKNLLPTSTGELAEIVVIYDKARSTDEFKEEVKNIFGEKLAGLPNPSESKFKVLFTDETFLKGYFKLHHNIFVLLNADNLDKMEKTYGQSNRETISELLDKEDVLGFNKEDIWSRKQNVFYVLAKDHNSLLAKMKEKSSDLLSLASSHEKQTAPSKVFNVALSKDSFYHKAMRHKGYGLRKPDSYRLAVEKDNFCWLRKESSKYDYEILIYDIPYTSQDQFSVDGIIATRDKITKSEIPGEIEGSYMAVDRTLPPHLEEVNLNDQYAAHMRGWWKVVGDWMGGPFISYSVYDKKRQRIVVAEGFIYGPNQSKARPLRELEVILNSLIIQ